MKLAIAILNWNGKTLLEKFLPSVVQYADDADIYVIDNGSTDESISFLKTHHPKVQIIALENNYGFTGGYNRGLKQIKSDLFCLLNSDIRVTPNWLSPVYEEFFKHPNLGIAMPKILDEKKPTHFEYAGAAGGFIDRFGYPYCRGRIFQSIEKDLNQYPTTTYNIFWATGACMFIRSEIFWQLGGFDEDYFAHQEEIDLCWRAHNQNIEIRYIGNSTVYHLGGSTLKSSNPAKTYLNFRNSIFNLVKNAPTKGIIPTILLRLVLDGVAAFHFLLLGKPNHFWAVIRAHCSFYSALGILMTKRNALKSTTKNNYYRVTSIVWLHFVKRVMTFNNLEKY